MAKVSRVVEGETLQAPTEGCDVVIAGCGVGATAAACSLIRYGFRPLLLRVRITPRPGAEALPPEARAQIDALGWGDVFRRAGAVEVDGFENALPDSRPLLRTGPYLHVDRVKLSEAALRSATDRGAVVLDCPRLPALREQDGEILLDSSGRRFFAAIDATGRAAAWSRPRRRGGRQVADLFRLASGPGVARGCIARASDGWAYRIGVPGITTIGSISSTRPLLRSLEPVLADRLGLPGQQPQFLGRWPAFPQWVEDPARGRRIAIGDAAFASDPVAGQGVRFALASALAAASVLRTIRDSGDAGSALGYYRAWVSDAIRRHLDLLGRLAPGLRGLAEDGSVSRRVESRDTPAPPLGPSALVQFVGRTKVTYLNVSGMVVPGTGVILPDGGLVRWLGAFDLLVLGELARIPVTYASLAGRLQEHHLGPEAVEMLLRWCLRNGLIAPVGTAAIGDHTGHGHSGNEPSLRG